MARTKQTARKATGGKMPRKMYTGGNKHASGSGGLFNRHNIPTQEELNKKRKELGEEREEKSKRIKLSLNVGYLAVQAFDDLLIKCCSPSSDACNVSDENHLKEINLFGMLKNMMKHHTCSEKCSALIPKINMEALFPDDIFDADIISNVGFCRNICDENCPEDDREFAMKILEEFIQEQDEFEAKLTEITLFKPNQERLFICEENVDRLASSIVEYRKCGKMCLYKKIDFGLDILILVINEYEYLYFGQANSHAFYGMPGLTYLSSDGSSPDVSRLYPKKVNDSFVPIPLNELLQSAKSFLGDLLLDRYH